MQIEFGEGVNPIYYQDISQEEFFSYIHYMRFQLVKKFIEKTPGTSTKPEWVKTGNPVTDIINMFKHVLNSAFSDSSKVEKMYYAIIKDEYTTYYVQEFKTNTTAYSVIMYKEAEKYWFVDFQHNDYPYLNMYSFKGAGMGFQFYWFETDKIYNYIQDFSSVRVKFIGDTILIIRKYEPGDVMTDRFFEFMIREAVKKKDIFGYYIAIDLLPRDVAKEYRDLHGLPVMFSRFDKSLINWVNEWLKQSKKIRTKFKEYKFEFTGHILGQSGAVVLPPYLIGYHPKLGNYTMRIPETTIVLWG